MKHTHLVRTLAVITVLTLPYLPAPAYALSCLPVDMYLKDVVGKDEIVIFEGTSIDRIDEKNYTAEVLSVTKVKQGYVEGKTFVYHQKDETWGYLCNSGPDKKGTTGLYVAERDAAGKYQVYQRLALTDANIKTLDADLKKAAVTGEVVEFSKTDRMNQIVTALKDLIVEITILLKEHAYWKATK